MEQEKQAKEAVLRLEQSSKELEVKFQELFKSLQLLRELVEAEQ